MRRAHNGNNLMGKYSSWDDRDCSTRKNCYRCHNWVSKYKACSGCYVLVEPEHVNEQICKNIQTALLKLETLNIDYAKMGEIRMGNCTRFIMDSWKHGFVEFGSNSFEVYIDAEETNELLSNIVYASYDFYGTCEDWCEHVDFSLIIDKVITPKVINRIKKAADEGQEMRAAFHAKLNESKDWDPIGELHESNQPAPKKVQKKPDLKIVR